MPSKPSSNKFITIYYHIYLIFKLRQKKFAKIKFSGYLGELMNINHHPQMEQIEDHNFTENRRTPLSFSFLIYHFQKKGSPP